MNDDEILKVNSKLNKLEQHLINLILPIQGITQVLRNSGHIQRVIELLEKPISIDDRFFKEILLDIAKMIEQFKEYAEKLDLQQTLSEIKYIGNRLNKIESDISHMKNEGIKRNVSLEFKCDGYELVKKPFGYQNETDELIRRLTEKNET
jgi:hypothetical protein